MNRYVLVIESAPNDLPLLGRDLSLTEAERIYALGTSAYLQGDLEKLERLCNEALPVSLEVHTVLELRRRLRLGLQDKKTEKLFNSNIRGPLFGEIMFLKGLHEEVQGRDADSLLTFQQASKVYASEGCPKKALRALYNSICAESRVWPDKNYIADFQAVINQAQSLNIPSIEGMALVQLSREYQKVLLTREASNLASQAVEKLKSEKGTQHYYHALLHQCHVLLELGQIEAASLVLNEVKLSETEVLTNARKILEWVAGFEKDLKLNINTAQLLPTWKERLPELQKLRHLIKDSNLESVQSTALEERLISLLSGRALDKWTLIEALYPHEASSLALENRFKNLAARVRKKFPGLLFFENGRYQLKNERKILCQQRKH